MSAHRTPALAAALGLVLGAIVATTPACFEPIIRDVADAGIQCVDGLTLCDNTCADTRTDDSHCGGCATICTATEACAAGACAPRDCPGADCSGDQVCLNDRCTGRACLSVTCDADRLCHLGACYPVACDGGACPQGQACIGGACAEPEEMDLLVE